jgi:hypothetical protein
LGKPYFSLQHSLYVNEYLQCTCSCLLLFLPTMPRRSPSPDSFKNYRDSNGGDTYRSRRDDPSRLRRSADLESRSGPRDQRGGVPERDTQKRAYYDDDRRRSRRRDGYDSHDDRRQRRDEDRDGRYVSRHDEGENQDHRSPMRAQGTERHRYRDRGEPRDRGDDERRDPSRRRSASPRRSRPHSRSRDRSRDRDRDQSRSESPAPTPAPEDKGKPNFAASGLLAAATNTVKNSDGTSTLLKYNEPPEARKPLVGWRLYVFKGEEQVGASLPPLSPCLSITRPYLLITRSFDVLLGFSLRSTPYPSPKCVPHRSRPLGNRHTPRTPVVLEAARRDPVYLASFSPASM